MNEALKWGILSTAKIGVRDVIPAIQKSKLGNVAAISSRTIEAAIEAADKLKSQKLMVVTMNLSLMIRLM